MTTATPQSLEAFQRANDVIATRKLQRESLRSARPRDFVRTLIDPPSELASYRLIRLFGGSSSNGAPHRPIPGFGPKRLEEALESLRDRGHRWAVSDARLRDLAPNQRRLIARTVLEFAPAAWRDR